jgi:FtsP/CotA-like multicopper oxidase with cupredoxin domain
MHLHGFYFRVNGVSDGVTDTLYKEDQQRMAVTEVVNPFQAVELAWRAERSGNWAFHCHYATHINSVAELDTRDGTLDPAAQEHHPSDRPHHMSGLVMGITVAPKEPEVAGAEPARKIRIEQREKPRVYGEQSGLSYIINDSKGAADPSAMPVPGPVLVLERGKRVQVTIVNQSSAPAAVHWHGIELESYPDGIPGWSGSGKQLFPVIAPRDSLSVRWTPPRAGSFMYHSHIHEAQQMGSGLYGPIIVLEPGERFDPESDRLFFFGTAGTQINLQGSPPEVLLNGATHPGPMHLTAGKRYRFRFFNLAGDGPILVSLNRDGKPVEWRAVAKDGYPLPEAQAVGKPATLLFDPGEIYDYEFIAGKTGELSLVFGWLPPPPPQPGAPAFPPVPPPVAVAVHVQ